MLKGYFPLLPITVILATFSFAVCAGEYYRWQDKDGVTHYGATPPQGVEATKIRTYGDGSHKPVQKAPSASTSDNANNIEGLSQKEQQEIAQRQQDLCNEDRQRLKTFKTSGRIRMKMEDGSTRYLTQAEIVKEIKKLEKSLSDTCS